MRRAVIYSLILHGVLLILLIVGIYNPFHRSMAEQRPLMMEFEAIADFSQAPVITPQATLQPESLQEVSEQSPAPQKTPPKPVQPQPEVSSPPPQPAPAPQELPKPESVAPPSEHQTDPLPDPDAAPLLPPEPKKQEPKEIKKAEPKKPEDKKKSEDKKQEEPKKEKVNLNLDKTKPKPKTDPQKDKKKVDKAFNDLINDVAQEDSQDEFSDILDTVSKTDKKGASKSKSSGRVRGAPADRVGPVVTGTQRDAIQRHFSRCWIVPNGVRGAKDLAAKVTVSLHRDGSVQDVSIVDKQRMGRDRTFRAVAESAQRAPLDPKCRQLNLEELGLNPDRYDEWKEMNINFNPKDLY